MSDRLIQLVLQNIWSQSHEIYVFFSKTNESNLLRASWTGFLSGQEQRFSSYHQVDGGYGATHLRIKSDRKVFSPRRKSRNAKQEYSMLSLQIPTRITPCRLSCVHIKFKMLVIFVHIVLWCQCCLRRNTEWHKKNGNFWKTQQKLKKSKKKNLLTEIEPLQLAF